MRKTASIALGVSALLALSACTGTGSSGSSSSNASNATLTYGSQADVTTFDPYLSVNGSTYNYLVPLYDTLIRLGSNGKLEPDLATSWGYADNGLQFDLTLRSGVKFSDGTPFNAQAVKVNIERAKKINGPETAELAGVSSVTAVNPTHAVINLSIPQPSMTTILSDVLGMMVSPKAIAAGTVATDPVGAGPYVLNKSETTTGDTYTFTRNKYYWDKSAFPFNTYVVRVIPDENTLYSAFKSGEVDVVGGLNDQVANAQSAGYQVIKSPVNFSGLFLLDRPGKVVPALGNVKVRQAMNYAVDRTAIVKAVSPGLGTPTSQWITPGLPGYVKSLNNYYTYNVPKAKQLMKEAGYPNGFTLKVQTAPFLGLTTTAQLIGSYLSKIGITLQIDEVSPSDFISDLASGRDPAAQFLFGVQDTNLDAHQLITPTAIFNPFHGSDAKLNSILAEAQTAAPAQRTKLYEQFNERLTQQAWFLITNFEDVTVFANSKVKNVTFWPSRAVPSIYGWAPAK